MNENVVAAVLRLQGSLMYGRLQPWRADQTEEALNRLLSSPHRSGDPFHLQRNAMSDARKKLQRRAALFADHEAVIDVMAERGRSGILPDEEPYDILRGDVIDCVQRKSSRRDQEILAIALEGGSVSDLAEALGIDYDVAKVRLSRARQRARMVWGNA
ncbi:MAG TPA: hypothetical protein VGC35_06105 [Allosphingosinicella sp.]|jgi:DNA-directed RNA polymerase specialized sigma24 family protein